MIQTGVEKVVYRKEFISTRDELLQTDPDVFSGPPLVRERVTGRITERVN